MTYDADRLLGLLPAVYRIRDAAEGGPLRALLEVIADQNAVLEESLEQLYDDLFVETAAPWVLPYLGDLLGVENVPGDPLDARAEVANTLAWRRGKGTAHVLERIARDVSGVPARAVEFFELVATTQHVNHPRPRNRAWVDVRDALRLESLGGPFERLDGAPDLAHTADVRRPGRRGRYNLHQVGVFLWRMGAYQLTRSPASPAGTGGPHHGGPLPPRPQRFHFHPLGIDTPLVRLPATEEEPEQLAGPANVPGRITRRAMHARPGEFYGPDASLRIELLTDDGPRLVPLEQIDVCDLTGWDLPAWGRVALDPALGRIAFGRGPERPPLVSFYYGAAAEVGGGEYARPSPSGDVGALVRVTGGGALDQALADAGEDGVVEIGDSGRYQAPEELGAYGRRITVRAVDGARPTLWIDGRMTVRGGPDSAVTLDGVLLAGGQVVVEAEGAGADGLGRFRLRHCTLVPGHTLTPDGTPEHPGVPSLVVSSAGTEVTAEHCILGPVRAHPGAGVQMRACIVDAGGDESIAYDGPDPGAWGAPLTLRECTVVGWVRAEALPLVSNSLLLARMNGEPPAGWPGPVASRRTQEGCVRFSYVPPGSRTPRRFQCVPARDGDDVTVRPSPVSTRYADAAYMVLPPGTPSAIRRGADDESEMGVHHDLHLPRREAHLRQRLGEYMRFGLDAGVSWIL
ncbi:MAG TPA: hypothetical protein VF665_19205 [Longimicrobium sp.]|jgi:hypothetical protein|uniref:hypothetical protein n=1 Tax=Longimicrobium sp. TaxID=2029185 RepID=UPI002ED8C166